MATWLVPQHIAGPSLSRDDSTMRQEPVPGVTPALSFLKKLKQFRDEDKLCDAYISIMDARFRAHKCVLAAWSPQFASQIFVHETEVKVVLHINYLNVEAMSDMLEYFYSGVVLVTESNVSALCDLAKNFSIPPLLSECEQYLRRSINISNYLYRYFTSLKYDLAALQEDIVNFIQSNHTSLIEQGELLRLSPVSFKTFLMQGKVSQMPHAILFTLIISWVGHDLAKRDQLLMFFLGHITWNHSVSDLLLQISRSENIFSTSDICMFQLLQSLATTGHDLGSYISTYQRLLSMYSHLIEDLKHPKVLSMAADAVEAVPKIPFGVNAEPYMLSVLQPEAKDVEVNTDIDSTYFTGLLDSSQTDVAEIEKCETFEQNFSDSETKLKADPHNADVSDAGDEVLTSGGAESQNVTFHGTELRVSQQDETELHQDVVAKVSHQQTDGSVELKVESETGVVLKDSEPDLLEGNALEKICVSAGITEPESKGPSAEHEGGKDSGQEAPVVDKAFAKHRRKSQPRKLSVNCNQTEKRGRGRPKKHHKKIIKEYEDVVKNESEKDNDSASLDPSYEPKSGGSKRSRFQKRSNLKQTKAKQERIRLKKPKEEKPELCKTEKTEMQVHHCSFDGCEYASKSEVKLERHMEDDHNPNVKLNCKRCAYSTCRMRDFCLHMKSHFTKVPYTCSYEDCGQQFLRMAVLIRHEMTHLEEKPYKCDLCEKSFGTLNQLKCHKKLHEGRQFECDVCFKRFTTKGVMQQHRGIHFDNKPYLCDTCGFSTKHLSHLISHRKIHSGDVLRCSFPDCTYSTPKQGHMTQHVNTHLNIRNHICQVCGKSFVVRGKLLRHERIHLKEKLFKCKQCDYQTSRTDRMKLHIESHGIKFKKKKYNLPLVEEEKNRGEIDYHQLYEKNTQGQSMDQLAEVSEHSDLPYSSLSLVTMSEMKPMDAISLAANASMIVDSFSPTRLGIVDPLTHTGGTSMSLEDFQNAGYQLKWVPQTTTFDNL